MSHAARRAETHGHAGRTLVLCYHAVSDSWNVPWSVTTAQLSEQLEFLVSRGYRSVTFHEAVTASVSGPTVAVTFDDGFASVLELAYPVLSSLGLDATVFVVTDFADSNEPLEWPGIEGWRGGVHEPEIRGLSWAELEQLAAAGWEVGSHTRTHRRLTQLDDDALSAELRGSRAACERALGRPCRSLAYPFGDMDTRVVAAAGAAGYEAAAALPIGVTRRVPLAWPRSGIYRKDSPLRFRLKVSPTLCRLREASVQVEKFVRAR
jgi:peptidoglycan/xylan/chitin deacetylase (PgdA/CDA1 family)